jgi:hypothetical protein
MRYKEGVIKTFLHRAFTICSDWVAFIEEIEKIKQKLVNNGFPQDLIEKEVKNFLNSKHKLEVSRKVNEPEKTAINVYYQDQMTSLYKQREAQLKKIMKNHIKPTEGKEFKLTIYYKSRKLRQLVIKNSVSSSDADEEKSNVVYQYHCDKIGCKANSYIGYTTNLLSWRMRTHFYNGSIKQHGLKEHKIRPTYEDIIANTKILKRGDRKSDLILLEALFISDINPTINQQHEGSQRILKVFKE